MAVDVATHEVVRKDHVPDAAQCSIRGKFDTHQIGGAKPSSGAFGQINDPAFDKRAPIDDSDGHQPAICKVLYRDPFSKGKRPMSGNKRIAGKGLAAGSLFQLAKL